MGSLGIGTVPPTYSRTRRSKSKIFEMMSIRKGVVALVLAACFNVVLGDLNDKVDVGLLSSVPLWLIILIIVIIVLVLIFVCVRCMSNYCLSDEDEKKERIRAIARARINRNIGNTVVLDDKSDEPVPPSSVYVDKSLRQEPPYHQPLRQELPLHQPLRQVVTQDLPLHQPLRQDTPRHVYQQQLSRHTPVYQQQSLSNFYGDDSSMSIPQPGSLPPQPNSGPPSYSSSKSYTRTGSSGA